MTLCGGKVILQMISSDYLLRTREILAPDTDSELSTVLPEHENIRGSMKHGV